MDIRVGFYRKREDSLLSLREPLLRVPLVCSAKSEPLSSKSALRRWTVGPSVVQPYPVSPVRGDTSVRMTGLEPATA